MNEYVDRINTLLKENNISAAKLEESMGLGFKTVRNYLKLKFTARVNILVEIAQRFGVSVDWLIGKDTVKYKELKAYSSCGERLKQLQIENGLKPKDIAEVAGTTVAATRALYREEVSYPSLQALKRLSERFDVSADWILGLTKQEDRK